MTPSVRILLVALYLLLTCLSGSAADTLDFSQLSFDLNGAAYSNTDWGSVDFTYTGQSSVQYFNLSVNGSWQVQNMPVLSANGVGSDHTVTYSFSLGNTPGTTVNSLDYGYSLSSDIVSGAPATGVFAQAVTARQITFYSGVTDAALPPLAAAAPTVGGAVADTKHTHSDVPNQECGKDECAPTAVSNSLKLLKKEHKLTIKDEDISIAKMKEATKWGTYNYQRAGNNQTATGSWYTDGKETDWKTNTEYEHKAWWKTKDAYMKANNLGITTRMLGAADIDKIGAEIDRKQDVELQGNWHTAMLVSIQKLANGKYAMTVAHDTAQGNPGGLKPDDALTYDPATGTFTGSPGFFNGSGLQHFVVECPTPEPASFLLCGLGLGVLRLYRGSKRTL